MKNFVDYPLDVEMLKYKIKQQEPEVVRRVFEETLRIFVDNIQTEDGSIMCDIHKAFGSQAISHNCLGCNFAESTGIIHNYLAGYKNFNSIQKDFTIYILLLYLVVERIEVIFDLIKLPERYKEKHFRIFNNVRKWANFIKHPKAFILTHHPIYDFENSAIEHPTTFSVTVNDIFVEKFYTGVRDQAKQEILNKKLFEEIANKRDVIVKFPDIRVLTKNFCWALKKFVDVITKNEIYAEVLNDQTTLKDYFSSENKLTYLGIKPSSEADLEN